MAADSFDQIITIDGGGGCGKGTLGQLLAHELGWHLLDSGVLYRIVAWIIESEGLSIQDRSTVIDRVTQLEIVFQQAELGEPARVLCDNVDVTDVVRSEACGKGASKVSSLPWVRDLLLQRQKAFARLPGLIADGRDMGTVVFPQAKGKIFLTASLSIRAQRRYNQLKDKNINVDVQHIEEALAARDERDQRRSVSPLIPASDAYVLDTSDLSIDEVLAAVKKALDISRG